MAGQRRFHRDIACPWVKPTPCSASPLRNASDGLVVAALMAAVMSSLSSRPDRSNSESKLADELAARDATIARLEERISVLERIATERSTELNDELERLRA